MSRCETRKLLMYTVLFLKSASEGDDDDAPERDSGRLSSAASAWPHWSQVLTAMVRLPSSKKVTLRSAMVKPNHCSPVARLHSYQKPQARMMAEEKPLSSTSLT